VLCVCVEMRRLISEVSCGLAVPAFLQCAGLDLSRNYC
jgi:hypothetical protein